MALPINTVNQTQVNQKEAKASELKKSQDMFFKLLMTQLKCQDVENTVDMNQMTQQIFQMNELQTLMSIDSKLDGLNESMSGGAAFNLASNMIGKYALTQNDKITVSRDNSATPISYIVDGNGQPVDVIMKVLDNKGNIISENKMNDANSNMMQNFELKFINPDGNLSVEEGVYKVHILAYDKKSGSPLKSQIYTANKIEQATPDGNFINSVGDNIKLAEILALQASPMPISGEHNPFANNKHLTQNINDLLRYKA